ncbi:hypothetical protein ACTU3I_06435 [Microbacterium sp. RD1]
MRAAAKRLIISGAGQITDVVRRSRTFETQAEPWAALSSSAGNRS